MPPKKAASKKKAAPKKAPAKPKPKPVPRKRKRITKDKHGVDAAKFPKTAPKKAPRKKGRKVHLPCRVHWTMALMWAYEEKLAQLLTAEELKPILYTLQLGDAAKWREKTQTLLDAVDALNTSALK